MNEKMDNPQLCSGKTSGLFNIVNKQSIKCYNSQISRESRLSEHHSEVLFLHLWLCFPKQDCIFVVVFVGQILN